MKNIKKHKNLIASMLTIAFVGIVIANPIFAQQFENPLAFNTVEGFLGSFLTAMRRIIVVLALVFIVVGAIMYVMSSGDTGRIESAKKTITAALIGLAIGIAAPSLLREVYTIIGGDGVYMPTEVSAATGITQITLNVLNFLLSIFGILAVIMLIIGGIMYLTSAGDEDRIDTGKKIFKTSLIGVIIAMSAMVLVRQIAQFFA